MEAQLAVELERDSGLWGGEYLSHSTAVTFGRVSRQEAEQQTQPLCRGGCLGVMAQGELWGGALSHWGLLLFVVDPAVTDCAGPRFSDGCSMLVTSKGGSLLSLLKRIGKLRSQHGLNLGFRGFVTPTASLWCLPPKFPSSCCNCCTQPKLPKP